MDNSTIAYEMNKIAEEVLRGMIEKKVLQEKERRAFVLTLRFDDMPVPFSKTTVGISFPTNEFGEKCWFVSEEKSERLVANPEHVTSAESRNFDEEKYAGAIAVRIDGRLLIISVSGLKEWEDTAAAIAIARTYSIKTGISIGSTTAHPIITDEIIGFKGKLRPTQDLLIKMGFRA